MKSIVLKTVLLTLVTTMTLNVSAHRTGHHHRHGKHVVRVPTHHHAHPVATVAALAGIAIMIDAAGQAKTESGQEVVVLDSSYVGDGKTEVIESNGKVYIIK